MESKTAKATPDFRMSLHGLPYDQTVAAKAPKTSPSHLVPDSDPIASQKTSVASTGGNTTENAPQEHTQNGAGQITNLSPRAESSVPDNTSINGQTLSSPKSPASVPQIRLEGNSITPPRVDDSKKWLSLRPTRSKSGEREAASNSAKSDGFLGLTLDLPSGGLGEELATQNMKFSNRGSMLLDGRKLNNSGSNTHLARPRMPTNRIPSSSSMPERLPPRIMSTDEETLSEKVRSFYAVGSDTSAADAEVQANIANQINLRWQNAIQDEEENQVSSRAASMADSRGTSTPQHLPVRDSMIVREDSELAGGLEDWQDVENALVDRYGFIVPKSPVLSSHDKNGVKRSGTVNGTGLQRVSTSLQLAADAPRRKHTIRRSPSAHEDRSGLGRKASNQSGSNSPGRPASSRSANTHKYSTFRSASNRLPGNRDRRLLDEAGDMLTLPRSLTAGNLTHTLTTESDHSTSSANRATSKSNSIAARKKEAEREEKWRKMATPLKDAHPGTVGGGMLFSFPPASDTKLVSRTWKGIPDSWRSAAWHYFLSVSARKNPNSLPDDALIEAFYSYQEQNSPDDVQIDIDVPRTISSHIMFRRRYRGGQRLLFRVLHAMSLHFAETGYVQGMAALAATLLAYYEEEKAFVMLVRLWDVRGLGRLYQSGFGGLMEALEDFEKGWLGEGEVAKKLAELNIVPTAYGTKWYLTLFNYSIPFPAQLRVWDVFMLLGDDDSISQHKPTPENQHPPLATTLDVLHATSAALIDGMRDILLESDFENAMKVLTSWIPIRDEDLFMRVAKAEWKMHRKKG